MMEDNHMKKILTLVTILLLAMSCSAANGQSAGYNGQGSGRGVGGGAGKGAGIGRSTGNLGTQEDFAGEMSAIIADFPEEELSAVEVEHLLFMYEEEKLARDVYAALYKTWNIPIFNNISSSEQQHMDAVAMLLDRYNLPIPTGSGFQNTELAALYDELVKEGQSSLIAALEVGATIEDLDIADLQKAITESDNTDLKVVFQNLSKGSRNHLRSFTAFLERENVSYAAQYIDQAYLEQILSLNREITVILDPDYSL
jgi:hypothetical protein